MPKQLSSLKKHWRKKNNFVFELSEQNRFCWCRTKTANAEFLSASKYNLNPIRDIKKKERKFKEEKESRLVTKVSNKNTKRETSTSQKRKTTSRVFRPERFFLSFSHLILVSYIGPLMAQHFYSIMKCTRVTSTASGNIHNDNSFYHWVEKKH